MFYKIYKKLHVNQLKGKDRLYKFLKNNNLPFKFKFRTSIDVWFNIDPKNYIDHHIITSGGYETEVLDALSNDVNKNTVLWDIGANIGFHSLSFKKKNPNCNVYSFEPDYENFASLTANKILNGLNISLLNFALSDKNATADLHTMDGNNGMSTLNPWPAFNWNKNSFTVACLSGDYLIQNKHIASPTLIKLDVEGHELKVLLGLRETIANGGVKKIIIEQPNNFLEVDSQIKTFLQSHSYTFSKLERQELTEHPLSNFEANLS
jgi:FkbM family methyltransferase